MSYESFSGKLHANLGGLFQGLAWIAANPGSKSDLSLVGGKSPGRGILDNIEACQSVH